MSLKAKLLKNRIIFRINKIRKDWIVYRKHKNIFEVDREKRRVFYLGIPVHTNLGDLAQGMCIRRWLKKHYSDCVVIEIETNALVNTCFSIIERLKEEYREGDIVVFQSGYTTTDLGGYAELMHREVMKALPNAKMLMLPQTIFFKSEKNKILTSEVYSKMGKNLLFLARDRVSYEYAKEMFNGIPIEKYPDIVTTLIGNYTFDGAREGIIFCCRNDGEKWYSDVEINTLIEKCSSLGRIQKVDTTKAGKSSSISNNAEEYIMREIELYSKFKVVITDRYHGTILSLVAGTPVIILKTTDHKVVTGAEWFRGIYDDYVYVAENLDDAYSKAKELLHKELSNKLSPYFEMNYYDKLPKLFESKTGGT